MPHLMREKHLDDLCASCKKPHGNSIELLTQHHKIYEVIKCVNCGYENIRERHELTDRFRHI